MNYNTIKFKNFKHIDKVFRKQANEIDRLNCYRFDRNERISSLPKKLLNYAALLQPKLLYYEAYIWNLEVGLYHL